jgi:hypothetical protein
MEWAWPFNAAGSSVLIGLGAVRQPKASPTGEMAAVKTTTLELARRALATCLLCFASVPSYAQNNAALLLFGGPGHQTFLGCINCSQYEASSICNAYGDHGSKFNSDSIWNKFGNFGSRFSDESPWNPYASQPPVIVDKDGNFYGYLTANRFTQKRTTMAGLVSLTNLWEEITDDPDAVSDRLCGRT